MTASRDNDKRILIGACCFADAEAAFRLLERIERQRPLELGGVFVDEGYITELARLPMQRVVTPGGHLTDLPTVQQGRTMMARDARAFRQMLSTMAQARSVKWSFEERSGDLIRHLFDVAKDWDILLLGRRTVHNRAGQIVVVADASHQSERAGLIAGNLAKAAKTDHVTLAISQEHAPHLTEDALFIFEENEASLLSRLSRMNTATVVIDLAADRRWSGDHIRQLLEAARCPLIVLGPKPARSQHERSAPVGEISDPSNRRLADE